MRIASKRKREKPKGRFKVKRKALEKWRDRHTNTEVGSRWEGGIPHESGPLKGHEERGKKGSHEAL